MNRIIGIQKDLLGGPDVPVWSSGRPPKQKREAALPKARKRDPSTSHAAAEQAVFLAQQHRQQILAALRSHGPSGKDRIAALTQLTAYQVSKRLREMQDVQLIKLTGRKVLSASGREEREWCAAEAAA